jgi:pectinesterase
VLFGRLVVGELRQAVPELAPMLRAEPVNANPVAKESQFDAVVSADGSGTHTTMQQAVAAAPDNSARAFRILIKPGKYEGQLVVPKTKRNLRFEGEETETTNTILSYNLNVFETNSATDPHFKGTGVVVLADDFHAENITFQNSSGDHGQALALRVDGDRAVFNHCRMLGWQDTVRLNQARQYLTNCYIEGRVDFIYGSATAVFDHCEIHSKNGGFVTAANTPPDKPYGFVFLDCKLTGDSTPWGHPTNTVASAAPAKKVTADLGRPWRAYACVTYLNCWMGDHIRPEGWNNWGNITNELTARFSEYQSTGPGANPGKRLKWSKQMAKEAADKITVESVLGGSDGWNPALP